MHILGKHVVLRAIERQDLTILHQWANDPEIQNLLGGFHFPTNLKDQEEWYSTLSCNSLNQRFVIETEKLGLIGTANLVSIDWKNRNAFHGLMLGDKAARGKGYGVDTLMALMRYAFDELGLARMDTDIVEYNTPSIKMHVEKCGWIIEGRKSDAIFRQGRYWEKLIMGITRTRYIDIINSSGYWR